MTKNFLLAGLVLLAASCSNESELTVVEKQSETAPVTVRINDFSITQEDLPTTRAAQNPVDYTAVGTMTLAFYDADGTEVYKATQLRGDGSTYTTFGEFTANLQVGTYTMVALGYTYFDGDAFTLTSPTQAAYTSERPRETFTKVQTVTVTSASALDLDVTLNRISSWLKIVSTDGRPASATKIRTTFAKGGKSFNPTTGLATTDAGFNQTNNPSTAVGATIEVNAVPFLSSATARPFFVVPSSWQMHPLQPSSSRPPGSMTKPSTSNPRRNDDATTVQYVYSFLRSVCVHLCTSRCSVCAPFCPCLRPLPVHFMHTPLPLLLREGH